MESSSSPCELSLEDLDNNETDLLPPSSQTQTQTLLLPSNTNKRHCTSFNNNTPTLRRCSETLISQPHPQQVERPACPRLIPGPAGTIQAAMHRQLVVSDRGNRSGGASQEYLRRGREDGDDGDFKANAWVCAMGFVGGEGGRFPLSSIKAQILTTQRVPQVVAFVVSCTPNGLGDLVTTLKDPTGTIGANIHRKVLLESEFGKDISVGSVLILHQVAVFAVSRSANYLNITLSNVVKLRYSGVDCGLWSLYVTVSSKTKKKLVSPLKIHRKPNSKKKDVLEMGDPNERLTLLETTVSTLTSTVGELVEQLRLTNLALGSVSANQRSRSKKKGVMEVDGDEDVPVFDDSSDVDFIKERSGSSLNGGMRGYGAILRDHGGKPLVAAAGNRRAVSVPFHELQGFHICLTLALKYGYKNVSTDATTTIWYIKSKSEPPWGARWLVKENIEMIDQMVSFNIMHIFRETNRAADHLAGMYPGVPCFEVPIEEFSEGLKKFIDEDAMGKEYEWIKMFMVISKDAGPPSKTLGHPTFTAEIFKNLNKSDMQLEQGCSSSDCGSSSSRYRQHNDAELGEPLVLMRKEATTTTMETTSRGGDNVQKEQSSVVDDFSDNQQTMEGGCPNLISTSRDYQEHTGPVTFAGKSGGVQSLISTTSIPQWTDEQLEELFDDDDTLLFG
ncbi:hypothetical protein GIB67_024965 [Kingdonia uniflora]|uniref:RNase H type-1 domain-containing protein n=1 Tax=Kingdonia uniflora TaxID=39325 RepID=A0A7J7NZ46_9MAGN|nr:hypothetical protein GIB67_024965 [Kingdonia uniflora]